MPVDSFEITSHLKMNLKKKILISTHHINNDQQQTPMSVVPIWKFLVCRWKSLILGMTWIFTFNYCVCICDYQFRCLHDHLSNDCNVRLFVVVKKMDFLNHFSQFIQVIRNNQTKDIDEMLKYLCFNCYNENIICKIKQEIVNIYKLNDINNQIERIKVLFNEYLYISREEEEEELQDHILFDCNGNNNICYCRYHQYGCRKVGISSVMSLHEHGCIYSLVPCDIYCDRILYVQVEYDNHSLRHYHAYIISEPYFRDSRNMAADAIGRNPSRNHTNTNGNDRHNDEMNLQYQLAQQPQQPLQQVQHVQQNGGNNVGGQY